MNGKPTVISTFAGCGGSSLGYQWAGFKELLAIDFDKRAVETFKANFDTPIWQKDICQVEAKDILQFCDIKVGDLDILDGSPPCQGFSLAGKRKVTDPRNSLFVEYVRLVEALQPKVFVMENVTGMVKGKMKGLFKEVMLMLKSTNYKVKCKLMNSKYYGVPQARRRLIWIGVHPNIKKDPTFPQPGHEIITVKKALEDITPDEYWEINTDTEFGKQYLKLRPGQSLAKTWEKGSGFNTRRLAWNKPSFTVTKTGIFGKYPKLIHPDGKRSVSINECKRLCSFPDDFVLTGNIKEKWAVMGNAVMPKFMQAIAENIKVNILN